MRIVVGAAAQLASSAADAVLSALDGRAAPVIGVATGSSPIALYRELGRVS